MKILCQMELTQWRLLVTVFSLSLLVSRAQKVLVTRTTFDVQWACFEVETSENCCHHIISASQELAILSPEVGQCNSQLAAVPGSLLDALKLERRNVAVYSLTLPTEPTNSSVLQVGQFLWDASLEYTVLQQLETTSSPFLLQASEPSDYVSIDSDLSVSGGMHRLLYHQLHTPADVQGSFVFLTIPNSMFVDLDDAFQGPVDVFVRVHAASVCDIEQPAFSSGQHIIVLEVLVDGSSNIEISSKLHLRYPYPSRSYQQYVILPEPQLLCRKKDGSLLFQGLEERGPPTRILVAAGRDEDYDMVMWITILICWIGVGWMMLDLSYVAKWD